MSFFFIDDALTEQTAAVRGVSTSSSTSATTGAIATPAANAGDWLYVYIVGGTSITQPGAWTSLSTRSFYRPVLADQLSTTENFSGLSTPWSAICYAISGCDLATPPERPVSASGISVNPDPPSLTPSWGSAGTLWLALWWNQGSTNRTVTAYPSNYSLGQSTVAGTSAGIPLMGAGARLLTAATEDPGTATISSSASWVGETVAFRPNYL